MRGVVMYEQLFLCVSLLMGTILGCGITFLAAFIGFRAGRITQDASPSISESKISKKNKDILFTTDLFNEHINDGLENKDDERIGTI
jgi:hypothetical protein